MQKNYKVTIFQEPYHTVEFEFMSLPTAMTQAERLMEYAVLGKHTKVTVERIYHNDEDFVKDEVEK